TPRPLTTVLRSHLARGMVPALGPRPWRLPGRVEEVMCHSSHAHRGGCCGSSGRPTHRYEHHHYPGERFGVRRPLRFLAWKLDLEESQVVEMAAILNDLNTERAQADVDDRRALSLLAD